MGVRVHGSQIVVFGFGVAFLPGFEARVDSLGFLPSCLARRRAAGVLGSFGVESPICIDAVRSLIVPIPALMLLSSFSILWEDGVFSFWDVAKNQMRRMRYFKR